MLKKLVFKLLGAAFIVFGLSSYVGYLYTGQLPPFLSGLKGVLPARSAAQPASTWTDIGSLQGKTVTDEGGYQRVESGATTFYKWQDAQGRWHFDERKPPATVKAEQKQVSVPPVGTVAPIPAEPAATAPTAAPAPVLANPYSADGVQKIMEQARSAQKALNDHTRRTEEVH